jgi:hypothetical protein
MNTIETIENVQKQFPNVAFPNVYTTPAFYGRKEKTLIENKFAVVGKRGDEENFYAFVSSDYKIVRHEEVIAKAQEMVTKTKEYGNPQFDIRLLDEGAKMRCIVTFPEVEWPIKRGNDPVSPRISVLNSYDTVWELGINFEAFQKVCSNGLMAFRSLYGKSGRHKLRLDVDNMLGKLNTGMGEYSKQIGVWQEWANRELEAATFNVLWEELPFGENYRKELEVLPQTGTGKTIKGMLMEGHVNAWDAHSIVTQFLTHKVESELVQLDKGEKVEKVFGKYLQ